MSEPTHCCCLFDDADEPVDWCKPHADMRDEIESLSAEIGRAKAEIERLRALVDDLNIELDCSAADGRAKAETERLQKIIVMAYQRLGFTNQKNETMRILGTGLPKAQNTDLAADGLDHPECDREAMCDICHPEDTQSERVRTG